MSTWNMNSVPSHEIAAVLCTWDCWSISCGGWFHRLLVRVHAWGLPQRVFFLLNIIKISLEKDYAKKLSSPMTVPSLGCRTCGVFSSKERNTFCILDHWHPFVKGIPKLHLFLILIFPSLTFLSSGIFSGTLYADFVKVKLHFQLRYNSSAEL